MFDKLGAQRRPFQKLMTDAEIIDDVDQRKKLLKDAGLNELRTRISLQGRADIFAGELIDACELRGKPPHLKEHATALLALCLRDDDAYLSGSAEAGELLTKIIALYVPDHATKYPYPKPEAGGSSMQPAKELRILFLASNPSDTGLLSLKREFALVKAALEAKQASDATLNVKLELRENVRDEEINDLIATYEPHILHFAGHGDLIRDNGGGGTTGAATGRWRGLFLLDVDGRTLENLSDEAKPSGIVLETAANRAKILPDQVLVSIFSRPEIHEHIRLVFLNACWAEGQAELLVFRAAVPFAIGMKQPINDEAAVRFAQGFYQSLFQRTSLQSAFDSGRAQMLAVVGKGHDNIPTLEKRAPLIPATYDIFEHL